MKPRSLIRYLTFPRGVIMTPNTFRNWLRSQANTVEIDQHLLSSSSAARASRRLIQASVILNALAPLLAIVAIISLTAVSAMAQGPGGGTGIGGLMWAAVNYMTEKNWTKQALGGVFCFAFGSIASLAYSFSQGNAVNLDTDLGN